jgi:hypothetical protein
MEKLTIKNIKNIIGRTLKSGRYICEAGEYMDHIFRGEDYYQFCIYKLGDDPVGKQTVVLQRTTGNKYAPNDHNTKGKYELFCMGLQSCTYSYLTKQEIETPDTLIEYIETVMTRTEEFFKNKNLLNNASK